ncbi:hypothetical protein VIGAN_01025200 [Vigna angularis var. angularis]|uniref:Uncharacterized protein n=1 Tax=Vigna angularis var. angularis TaxID=157739 RepID=A0A0S3QWW4_PHAAN|nr:hypothetical protein VIGAN_01025200 [Vigna angularis var. angularis]
MIVILITLNCFHILCMMTSYFICMTYIISDVTSATCGGDDDGALGCSGSLGCSEREEKWRTFSWMWMQRERRKVEKYFWMQQREEQ